MKTCRACGCLKPLGEFYRHAKMADGRLNFCKACVTARVLRHRAANLDRVREYDRQRGQLPHRKEANKEREHRYVGRRGEYLRRYRQAHRDRERAHRMANRAIATGKLTPKPCERCGFALGVHAHHEDYSKPLDVNWLCTKCHGERHREINAERRARKAA